MKKENRPNNLNIRAMLTTVCLVLILINVIQLRNQRFKSADYSEAIDQWIVRVDDREYTLRDLAFYIAYEEGNVEEQAVLYNPNDPNEYWNIHTNGEFIRSTARNTCLDMAVHDFLLNIIAEERNIELDANELSAAENNAYDFWDDLGKRRQELIHVGEEEIKRSVEKVAIASKVQNVLAEDNNKSQVTYAFDGMGYNELLEEHQIEVNKEVWEKLSFGKITISR